MLTSTEKALRDFFTEERLEGYRDLHERFPLWCGDWPEPECLEPEYGEWWSRGARLVAAWSEAFGGEIMGVVDADSEDAPQKYLIGPPHVEGPVALKDVNEVEETAVYRALVEALDLCFAVPESQSEDLGQLLDRWTASLRDLANPESDRFVIGITASGRIRRGLPVNYPDPVNLWYAARLRSRILKAPLRGESREDLIKQLETYWLRVGREIEVIPRLSTGPPLCSLPDVFLAELLTQAESLVAKLIEFEPSREESSTVRRLLLADKLSQVQSERLRSLKRQAERGQVAAQQAERMRAEVEQNAVPDDEANKWARRLRFPVLTGDEIDHVGTKTGWNSNSRSTPKATKDLVVGRLPISYNTFLNRTRPYRH